MNVRLRQDAIVRSLRRNGTSTVADLAEEVGASRRTVLRDISALRDEGFVTHSEPGRGGGLQLDPQSVQTTARLSVGAGSPKTGGPRVEKWRKIAGRKLDDIGVMRPTVIFANFVSN